MDQQLKLHQLLVDIQGSEAVYFQPPSSLIMSYPCIVYKVDDLDVRHANNSPYMEEVVWQVTVIDRNPKNDTWRKIGRLPKCSFDRYAVVDNLNHYYFTLYF